MKNVIEKIKEIYSKRDNSWINLCLVILIGIIFFCIQNEFETDNYKITELMYIIPTFIFLSSIIYFGICKIAKNTFISIISTILIIGISNLLLNVTYSNTIFMNLFELKRVDFIINCIISLILLVGIIIIAYFCKQETDKEYVKNTIEKIKSNKYINIAINIELIYILHWTIEYGIHDFVISANNFNQVLTAHIFSFFLAGLLVCILFLILRKSHRAFWGISVFVLLISIISQVKLLYTDDPIFFSDIYMIGRIKAIVQIVNGDLFDYFSYNYIENLIVSTFILIVVSKAFTLEIKNKKAWIIKASVTCFITIFLLVPIQVKDKFILDHVYALKDRTNTRNALTFYYKHGFLAQIYNSFIENRGIPPEDYDEEEIEKILEEAGKEVENNQEEPVKPNIIIMFQESFWDIENLEEVDFDKDLTANFDKLKELGAHAKFLSPSYANYSCNIEYELLTGGNLRFYNLGFSPLIQLYMNNKSADYPSILKDLDANGYNTEVLFGFDYYGSENTYKKMGIKKYTDARSDWEEDPSKVKGIYLSDETFVSEAINRLKNKSEDERLFYMTCTYQSHSPFYEGKYSQYDINIVRSELTPEENGIVKSYAQGVYDTNVQIMRLYEEIQKTNDPTIVVVFGDHLPKLATSTGKDILLSSRYFNTGDERIDTLRHYSTDVYVFSNYGYKPEFVSEYVSPDIVLTTIVNDLNLKISPFYKWLYNSSKELVALNQYILVDKDGNYYLPSDDMPVELEKVLEMRNKMQYYFFR